jgi:protein associated with RNAse G/E
LKSDGTAYRWWPTTVESASDQALVTLSQPGKLVHGPAGSSVATYYIRATYWYDRAYNLFEVYRADGHLLEVYVNIASPARIDGHTLIFTDHELDIVLKPGHPPVVVDEDEFADAAERYGYTAEFQAACYTAVAEVLTFIENWQPGGIPTLIR